MGVRMYWENILSSVKNKVELNGVTPNLSVLSCLWSLSQIPILELVRIDLVNTAFCWLGKRSKFIIRNDTGQIV